VVEEEKERKKVLLHICCGVCALSCIERLEKENFTVKGFFFNPNIHPYKEYQRREQAWQRVKEVMNVDDIESIDYNPREWFEMVKEYRNEKEGGRRCSICFEFRLKECFKFATQLGFDYFSTTLTISPHKNSRVIIEIGKKIGKEYFLDIDFKKKNGFKRTMELAKKLNLYRQNYCGCVYSLLERRRKIESSP